MNKITFLLIILIAAVLVSFTAKTQTKQEISGSSPNEHFGIVCSDRGNGAAEIYVLDKQSGRVWQMRGQISQQPFLLPCTNSLLDGTASLTPISTDRELEGARTHQTPNNTPLPSYFPKPN